MINYETPNSITFLMTVSITTRTVTMSIKQTFLISPFFTSLSSALTSSYSFSCLLFINLILAFIVLPNLTKPLFIEGTFSTCTFFVDCLPSPSSSQSESFFTIQTEWDFIDLRIDSPSFSIWNSYSMDLGSQLRIGERISSWPYFNR